jgi:hypothetical protein
MRVVLYAHDMEPITILRLTGWQYDFLRKHGMVRLAVIPQLQWVSALTDNKLPDVKIWQVDITAEKFHRNGATHMMLFTHHEEHALLLKAAFLPGQQHALKEHERAAFAKGFLSALDRLSGE